MRTMLFIVTPLLSALVLSPAAIDAASLSMSVKATACAQDLGGQTCDRNFGGDDASASMSRAGAVATASGDARAGFGELGASGEATVAVSGEAGGVNALGGVEARASFDDILHLHVLPGVLIAPGTPITIHVALTLHDTIGIVDIDGSGNSGRAVATLFFNTFQLVVDDAVPGVTSPPGKIAAADFVVGFGDPIALTGELFAAVLVGCTHSIACAPGSVNAFETAVFNIDIVTPGVGYTTDSGASYVTGIASVAEPATLVLMGPGLLYLTYRCRTRLRHACSR